MTVRNVITSMRLISDVDWTELFESISLVDAMLRAGSDFARMDFPTRDLYRRAIEELARGSELPELDIARAPFLPQRGWRPAGNRRRGDRGRDAIPGYHLIGRRAPSFEKQLRIPRADEGLACPQQRRGGHFGLSRDCRGSLPAIILRPCG